MKRRMKDKGTGIQCQAEVRMKRREKRRITEEAQRLEDCSFTRSERLAWAREANRKLEEKGCSND